VIRFMKGYVTISAKEATPRTIASGDSCSRMTSPIASCSARKTSARFIEIAPLAIGRPAVRVTRRSKSRSAMSLMVQPAPRITTAPMAKRISSLRLGPSPGGAASAMDHQPGKSSSQLPIGRSSRASRQ
jgi:hypothetical protein